MIFDTAISRSIAALEFTDSTTGQRLSETLLVRIKDADVFRTRNGYWMVSRAPGFDEYAGAFGPIPVVANVDLEGTVEDRARDYLTRDFQLSVPRANVFEPVKIALAPSPKAYVDPNWGAVLFRVLQTPANLPVAGAYVRLVRIDTNTEFLGMTNERGEALVRIPQLPPVAPQSAGGNTNLFTREFAVTARAFAEPQFRPSRNPDAFDLARADLKRSDPHDFTITSGHMKFREITINAN